MAAQWQIKINPVVSPDRGKSPPAQDVWASLERQLRFNASPQNQVSFDPSTLDVELGDQIFWTNNDSQPHWPGLKKEDGSIDETFFMEYQIAGDDSSATFTPGVAATLVYACSLHSSEEGTIEVKEPPP